MASKQDQVLDGLKVKFAQLESQRGDNVALVRSINNDLHDLLDASCFAMNYAHQRTADGRPVFRVVPATSTTDSGAQPHV